MTEMKQPYICVCFPACVINVPECVCFELSIQRAGGKKIQLGVSTADRQPEGRDASVSIKPSYIQPPVEFPPAHPHIALPLLPASLRGSEQTPGSPRRRFPLRTRTASDFSHRPESNRLKGKFSNFNVTVFCYPLSPIQNFVYFFEWLWLESLQTCRCCCCCCWIVTNTSVSLCSCLAVRLKLLCISQIFQHLSHFLIMFQQ